MGGTSAPSLATGVDETDSSGEQGLEVDALAQRGTIRCEAGIRENGGGAAVAVTRHGSWRGEPFEGSVASRGPSAEPLEIFGSTGGEAGGNAANPRAGSRVQQTCSGRAEQTVEVVRDHEGGTSMAVGTVRPVCTVARVDLRVGAP
jgi:hypothetical protein